jgi:hypothetical protein
LLAKLGGNGTDEVEKIFPLNLYCMLLAIFLWEALAIRQVFDSTLEEICCIRAEVVAKLKILREFFE